MYHGSATTTVLPISYISSQNRINSDFSSTVELDVAHKTMVVNIKTATDDDFVQMSKEIHLVVSIVTLTAVLNWNKPISKAVYLIVPEITVGMFSISIVKE